MNIIFDYNGTLFDPENNDLYKGAYEVLEALSKDHKLYLFSYNEFGREKFMKDVNIDKFFAKISLVDNKDEKSMSRLIEDNPTDLTFVIGDSLMSEIYLGNKLGYETVRLKQGRFSAELPRNEYENPKYYINSIEEIFNVLDRYKKDSRRI